MATDLGIRVSQQARPLARVSMEKPVRYKHVGVFHGIQIRRPRASYPTWARMDPRDTAIIHEDYPPCSSERVRDYLATELAEYSYRRRILAGKSDWKHSRFSISFSPSLFLSVACLRKYSSSLTLVCKKNKKIKNSDYFPSKYENTHWETEKLDEPGQRSLLIVVLWGG